MTKERTKPVEVSYYRPKYDTWDDGLLDPNYSPKHFWEKENPLTPESRLVMSTLPYKYIINYGWVREDNIKIKNPIPGDPEWGEVTP